MAVRDTVDTHPEVVERRRGAFEVEVTRDVRIPTGESGVTLSADVFRPTGVDLAPVLLLVLPYRKDTVGGIFDLATFCWYARHGYACVRVDIRGIGLSGGRLRPPFDPGEVDDAIAAIEWAAGQPWCSGDIGMWGHSYGALMAMRTATRRPARLKAILPVMGPLDPERDFVHPAGNRGIGSVASWGMQALLGQLIPPLENYGATVEHDRWRARLRDDEPWLLELARRGPGDPGWRACAVNASAITVPTFCVGGWRDIFCDGTMRTYGQIEAPKKLLVGPWTHTMPDASPFQAIDFCNLALRWWDHWLNGVENGVMDEPSAVVYRQGEQPHWRQFDSWPPHHVAQRFATGGDTTLIPAPPDTIASGNATVATHIIGESMPDPTVGVLSGYLERTATGGTGLPVDQHEDDMRSLLCTSDAIVTDLVIAGSPQVTVRLAGDCPPRRMVVRLSDVDQQGCSTLISAGVEPGPAGEHAVVALTPTYYRIRAGHRVRVVLSEADFPLLWPAPEATNHSEVLRLVGVDLVLPVVPVDAGIETTFPPPNSDVSDGLGLRQRPIWTITRDLINDGVDVTVGQDLAAHTSNGEHYIEIHHDTSAAVLRATPAAALVRGTSTATVHTGTGETIAVHAELRMTRTALTATGDVAINGMTIFSHRWETDMPAALTATTRD